MSGTVPPPPPPPGEGPDDEQGAPSQEQHPPTVQTPVQQAPVQRVSAANRMPPAISPANQFAQAVTPAPAAPGAPVVQSVHKGGGDQGTQQQQYYPEQPQQGYAQPQPQQGYAQPQSYAQPQPQPPAQPPQAQYPPQGYQPQGYPPQGYEAQGYDQYGQPVYATQGGGYPPEPENERRKLSPGWIAFIVLDVLLVVAAIVFAVSLFSNPDDSQAGNPTATAEQSAEPSAETGLETGGEGVETFAAPSLNITCTISADAATCGIAELNQKPAPDASCDGASGYVAKVDPSGNVTQPCIAKGEQPKKAPGDTAQLKYGATKKAHGFTCTSADTGMTCVADSTGTGFSIARAGIGQA